MNIPCLRFEIAPVESTNSTFPPSTLRTHTFPKFIETGLASEDAFPSFCELIAESVATTVRIESGYFSKAGLRAS